MAVAVHAYRDGQARDVTGGALDVDSESRHFAPCAEGQALWQSASRGLLAARLPAPLAPLAPALAASLLDQPLRTALNVRRPPAPVRALVSYALRARARARARAGQ